MECTCHLPRANPGTGWTMEDVPRKRSAQDGNHVAHLNMLRGTWTTVVPEEAQRRYSSNGTGRRSALYMFREKAAKGERLPDLAATSSLYPRHVIPRLSRWTTGDAVLHPHIPTVQSEDMYTILHTYVVHGLAKTRAVHMGIINAQHIWAYVYGASCRFIGGASRDAPAQVPARPILLLQSTGAIGGRKRGKSTNQPSPRGAFRVRTWLVVGPMLRSFFFRIDPRPCDHRSQRLGFVVRDDPRSP